MQHKIGLLLTVCLVVGCDDKEMPTDTYGRAGARNVSTTPPAAAKISAWSWPNAGRITPMVVQPYSAADPLLYRVHVDNSGKAVDFAPWAAANPGHLYIVFDEPDGMQDDDGPGGPLPPYIRKSAADAAAAYCAFIDTVSRADPTAKFAPGGFSSDVTEAYLQAFLNGYKADAACSQHPIREWTFGVIENWAGSPVDSFKSKVLARAYWARHHGDPSTEAPIVVQSWTLDWHGVADPVGGTPDGDSVYVERLREARQFIIENPDIVSSRYLHFEQHGSDDGHPTGQGSDPDFNKINAHPLFVDGKLTPEGLVLAGYLADNRNMLISQSNVWSGVIFGGVYWGNQQAWIGGKRYYSAIGMHGADTGVSVATFRIPPGAGGFTSVFGLADIDGGCYASAKRGRVFVDGKLRWAGTISGHSSNTATSFAIYVPPSAQTLRLETDPMGSQYCAHTTWGDPHYTATPALPSGSPYQGEFLDDNPSLLVSQSNVHGNVVLGGVYWQPEVWMGGALFFHAVGMHVPASGIGSASFRIPQGANAFSASLGIARQDDNAGCEGAIHGRVYVNGTLRWSNDFSGGWWAATHQTGNIMLQAGDTLLRLETDGGQFCGHATWGNPQFMPYPVTISGPDTVSQAGSFTWNALVSGGIAFPVTWEESTDGGQSFAAVGTSSSSYTRSFLTWGNPSALVLRATMHPPTGVTVIPVTRTIPITMNCGTQISC